MQVFPNPCPHSNAMLIVADQNLPLLDQTFGRHASLRLRSGRNIGPTDLESADALLVKSITPVDASLLSGSGVRFVGSATIGLDHIDTAWLDRQGIHWANAQVFDALRRDYPQRHEFPHWRIEGADAGSRETLNALGFQVSRG